MSSSACAGSHKGDSALPVNPKVSDARRSATNLWVEARYLLRIGNRRVLDVVGKGASEADLVALQNGHFQTTKIIFEERVLSSSVMS